MTAIRTRFAPSPTGYIHIGGIRTALFSWLLAKQANGQFILRFEDTDKKRESSTAKNHILESLHAINLDYDEGPDKTGPFGPYSQSERLDIYHYWAEKLVLSGRAYPDPYDTDEIEHFKKQAEAEHKPYLYRNNRPTKLNKWDGKAPLRFKSNPKDYTWTDEVMGERKSLESVIDDFILIKSDGYPTYNFAHIIDDHLMQISHVIRGQEFLSSVPNYLNLYEALGISHPKFVTLPHVLNDIGNKKLSKRDDAKDVLDYIKNGYLPNALISFIATLGWNDGTTQEIYSRQELIEKFSLGRIQKSGARLDLKRLDWVNAYFIKQMPTKELLILTANYWPVSAKDSDDTYKLKVLGLLKDRLRRLNELATLSNFFFEDLKIDKSLITNHKQLCSIDPKLLKNMLELAIKDLTLSSFSIVDINSKLNHLLKQTGQPPAILFSLIRIATSQAPSSPGLGETLAVLGKEKVLRRLKQQVDEL